jgi:hypothetical protein
MTSHRLLSRRVLYRNLIIASGWMVGIEVQLVQLEWTQGAELFGKLGNHLLKAPAFAGGNPLESKPSGINSHFFKKDFGQWDTPHALVITFMIVAITGMAATDQYTIGTGAQCIEDETRIYAATAHDSHAPHICGIFHAGGSCEIRSRVAAPIAEDAEDFRFEFHHTKIPSICA